MNASNAIIKASAANGGVVYLPLLFFHFHFHNLNDKRRSFHTRLARESSKRAKIFLKIVDIFNLLRSVSLRTSLK